MFRLDELLWERWMADGTDAFVEGNGRRAAMLWRSAANVARDFAENDPRRAAALCALATLAQAEGRHDAARLLWQRALERWDAAADWVERMEVGQGARSSTFHLRLEAKHRGAYPEIVRVRLRRTLAAGRAGSVANLAALDRDAKALTVALEARREAFGARESGAAAIAARLGLAIEQPVVARFRERPPVAFDDERRLHAAALLAPVLAARGA